MLWAGVVITFAAIVAFGAAVVYGALLVLDRLDAPAWIAWSVWAGPTAGVLVWALKPGHAATASDDEAMPWSDYSVRAVMIGIESPRALPARVATAALFGAPLVVYLALALALEALGIL